MWIIRRIDVHCVRDVRLLLHEIIDAGSGDVSVQLAGAEISDADQARGPLEAYNRARRAGRQLAVVDMKARQRGCSCTSHERAMDSRDDRSPPPLSRRSPP